MIIPVILSWDAMRLQSPVLLALAVTAHFGALKLAPICRHRENLWMFLLVVISTIPLNLYLLMEYGEMVGISRTYGVVSAILQSIIWYEVLLSVEELIMGIITRRIWKKQYKLPTIYEEDLEEA